MTSSLDKHCTALSAEIARLEEALERSANGADPTLREAYAKLREALSLLVAARGGRAPEAPSVAPQQVAPPPAKAAGSAPEAKPTARPGITHETLAALIIPLPQLTTSYRAAPVDVLVETAATEPASEPASGSSLATEAGERQPLADGDDAHAEAHTGAHAASQSPRPPSALDEAVAEAQPPSEDLPGAAPARHTPYAEAFPVSATTTSSPAAESPSPEEATAPAVEAVETGDTEDERPSPGDSPESADAPALLFTADDAPFLYMDLAEPAEDSPVTPAACAKASEGSIQESSAESAAKDAVVEALGPVVPKEEPSPTAADPEASAALPGTESGEETLEQRLNRLYRQSEELVVPNAARGSAGAEEMSPQRDTGLARFLERQATPDEPDTSGSPEASSPEAPPEAEPEAPSAPASLQAMNDAPAEAAPQAEAEPEIVPATTPSPPAFVGSPPVDPDEARFLERRLAAKARSSRLRAGVALLPHHSPDPQEAKVAIVTAKHAAHAASDGESAASFAGASRPFTPAGVFVGEEASVEIVRTGARGDRRPGNPALPSSTDRQAPIVGRFLKALRGD